MAGPLSSINTVPHFFMAPADMASSYTLAGTIVREQVNANPQQREIFEGITRHEVVVVPGNFDHMHHVLNALQVPFDSVVADQLTHEGSLRGAKLVFVNCGGSFPKGSAQRLANFVEAGGVLLTTDWALKNVLEAGFLDAQGHPRYVRHNGLSTGDEIVDVDSMDLSHPLIRGILPEHGVPRWWLERSSFPIELVDPGVRVLARSAELGNRYRADPVIVQFPHGAGAVVHMISHLFLQKGGAAPGKKTGKASGFTTSLGASEATIVLAEKMEKEGGAAPVDEETTRAAFVSARFVANTITLGKTGVGAMMGAAPRSDFEKGRISHEKLPWVPSAQAQQLNPDGTWNTIGTPFRWNPKKGLYELALPVSNTYYLLGRQVKAWSQNQLASMRRINEIIRSRNPTAQLIFVPIQYRQEHSPISRLHALIQPIGEKTYRAIALDGDLTVLTSDDPGQDQYRQAKQEDPNKLGASSYLSHGQRLKLAPDVVFLVVED